MNTMLARPTNAVPNLLFLVRRQMIPVPHQAALIATARQLTAEPQPGQIQFKFL
jgi:hypothetical protein